MMNGPIDMSGERVNMPPTDGLQVIPEAAVEAAVEAIIAAAFGQELPEAPEDLARAALEAALEAAAPIIAEEAVREAAKRLMDVQEHESRMPGIRFAVGFLSGQKKP